MTALHKHPPAPRAKTTTHSQPRAGHDRARFAYVLEKRNEAEPRPWLGSNVAMLILCAVVCAITWVAADHVWGALTTAPGVVWE